MTPPNNLTYTDLPFKDMVLTAVEVGHDSIVLQFDLDRRRFQMHHTQDCCENVWLEDVVGDWNDILYAPMLVAEEATCAGEVEYAGDSATWTFYRFRTHKGEVSLRRCGTSNGYYSERIDIDELTY